MSVYLLMIHNMLFICMVSLLSWYTIQINNPSVADFPIEDTEVVNTNTSKTINVVTVPKSEKIDSWVQEENLNVDIEDDSDSLNEETDDQYEEIIFQDNFDKEYRSWTEDNYLED